MDQSHAPLLVAVADYHRSGRYGFTPPGHRQGAGTDPRVLEVLGKDPFCSDLLATPGLDDRKSRGQFLTRAEELMADAVGAAKAFFSTCGSSLSVRAAMMAVAGGAEGGLLVARDSHRSVVAGLIFSGVVPGERRNDAVIEYLRSGVEAGMTLPDPTDPTAHQFRAVA